MSKNDTIARARELGIDLPDNTDNITEAEVQEKIDAYEADNADEQSTEEANEETRTVDRDGAESGQFGDVASTEANDALEHSEGGQTTRSDRTDLGVPMLPGSPDEPVGPEDAFGDGPKRGDYSIAAFDGSVHTQITPDGVEHQNPKSADQGEVAGEKGGVTTG